jgi:sulfate adenylyltransferase
MDGRTYEAVLDRWCLPDGTFWPVPICLDVSSFLADRLEAGQSLALRDPEGYLLAVMHVNDIWPVDARRESLRLYGTDDPGHAGPAAVMARQNRSYVGGSIEVLSLPLHSEFRSLRLTPAEVRAAAGRLGWHKVVAYCPATPIHRPQFEITLGALRALRANLLIMPVTWSAKNGDFDFYTRIRCVKAAVDHYPPDTVMLNLLPLARPLGGGRDQWLLALIAKNFGCSHLQEAEPPADGAVAAEAPWQDDWTMVGIERIVCPQLVYLPFEDLYRPADQVPSASPVMVIDHADIRQRVRQGRTIPAWATFPEVASELSRAYPPPAGQGFTLFFTGLSGAGKSTIAKVLYARFLEMGARPVTLLDGDIVRRNLSSELTFSKEHRDINVRRIGFVASEITKNRGIAICAPIAPYRATRSEIRRQIESYGGFFEIHVATSLAVCEQRDRKGMYAKARAGLIKDFTGVDDPYETPEAPELSLDTAAMTPDEAAQEVLLLLGQRGYI